MYIWRSKQIANDVNYFSYMYFLFVFADCCFSVQITKGPRGLGLSVSGGVDSNTAFPGLIRIKRLFPHQVAWSTGMLHPGDILLEANGICLTGLTNYVRIFNIVLFYLCVTETFNHNMEYVLHFYFFQEALEVLRTTPNVVTLTVCRPRDEQYRKLSPPTEPPKPPQRAQPNSLPLYPIQTYYTGVSVFFFILFTFSVFVLGGCLVFI